MAFKPIGRRSFLRSGGSLIALPFLEAMLPLRASAQTAAKPPLRFIPIIWHFGTYLNNMSPIGSGSNYDLPEIYSALAPHRSNFSPIRGVSNHWAGFIDGAGDHGRAQGTYLTCVHINKSITKLRNATSVDQAIANSVGNQTPLKSLFLYGGGVTGEDSGYSSAYSHVSWINAKTPNPYAGSPAQVFQSLFGNPTNQVSDSEVLRTLRLKKSILDGAMDDSRRLMASIGSNDKERLDQYLSSVREVESRISNNLGSGGGGGGSTSACSPGQKPSDNSQFEYRTKAYFDLIALALQCDLTSRDYLPNGVCWEFWFHRCSR